MSTMSASATPIHLKVAQGMTRRKITPAQPEMPEDDIFELAPAEYRNLVAMWAGPDKMLVTKMLEQQMDQYTACLHHVPVEQIEQVRAMYAACREFLRRVQRTVDEGEPSASA